jgi:uncharacterized membrane protein
MDRGFHMFVSMSSLIALVSAALYGAADFLGGVASRRASTAVVVAVSQAAGLIVLLVVIALLPPADPSRADIAWGALAGMAGSLGVGLLYRALAIGTMGVVAPITAVCAVVLPVLVNSIRRGWPGPLVVVGIVLALVGIVLVSQQAPSGAGEVRSAPGRWPPGVPHALVSGVAIGVFFLVLAEARPQSGLAAGASFRLSSAGALGLAMAAGVVDMTANVLYLLASREGSLPVAVTLSSLYPASTVVLARLVLGERLHWVQLVGMGFAAAAVGCIIWGDTALGDTVFGDAVFGGAR